MEYNKKSVALKNIRDLCRTGKLAQARKYLEEYKAQYEEEVASIFADAKVTFYEGNLDRAGVLLKKTIELSNEQQLDYSKLNYAYYLLEVKSYKEAYSVLCSINLKKLYQNDKATYTRVLLFKAFIEKEQQLPSTVKKMNIYMHNQIINYNSNDALEEVYKKHDGKIENLKGRSSFKMSFEELRTHFYQTQERIKDATKDLSLDFVDHYYFKKENIGVTDEKKPTNIFTVITLKHSNQIITMYPVDNTFFTSKLTNEFGQKEDNYSSSKQRVRKSQIDKFNSKYNIK